MKESAYLLNFGYQLCHNWRFGYKNDVIVYDVDAHACIIDGVRLHMENVLYHVIMMKSMEKNLQRATN
jgi:glycine C-acetyltransferase